MSSRPAGSGTRYKQQGNWRQDTGQQQQQNNLRSGLCGLFFTVDGYENRAVREAHNLIDHFLSSKPSESEEAKNSKADDDDWGDDDAVPDSKRDISDSLNMECQQIQQKRHGKRHVDIRQVATGARCSLFFTSPLITPENVYTLAEQMVNKCQRENWTRFLARVIPVEETCPAYMDQIVPAVSAMVAKHLGSSEQTLPPPSYAIDFKASNTKLLKREQIYEEIGKLMKEQSPTSAVNLTQPDILIIIHAIRTVTLLSIVRNFYQLRKFALRPPTANENAEGAKDANKEEQSMATTSAEKEGEVEEEMKEADE